jgi:hypothetical protein
MRHPATKLYDATPPARRSPNLRGGEYCASTSGDCDLAFTAPATDPAPCSGCVARRCCQNDRRGWVPPSRTAFASKASGRRRGPRSSLGPCPACASVRLFSASAFAAAARQEPNIGRDWECGTVRHRWTRPLCCPSIPGGAPRPEGSLGDIAHQGAVKNIQAQPDQVTIPGHLHRL